MSKIKKNLFYNTIFQVLVLILPFITTPYISRVIGAEKIGVYSYSYSVASYFALFIILGLTNYGNRTIAMTKDDKKILSKNFISIYCTQLFMGIVVLILYMGYVIFISNEKIMAGIQTIYIISVILDISWFYFGLEEFKLTVILNTIVKILNLLFIFMFVKSKNDIYIYGFIMVLGMLVSQVLLWAYLPKYVSYEKISISDIIIHIKPNLKLFVPVIAISLYTIMDKVMLGIMSDMVEVGYYESSSKLTQIPRMAITSLGTVMMPRISNMIAKGEGNEASSYIQKSLIVAIFVSVPMALGLTGISNEFVPIFYGEGFDKCKYLIPILVTSSIFMAWANVIRTQYLIPNNRDDIYIKSVFLGALINLITNIILIPYLQSIGAAIGTLLAEMIVCLYQTYTIKNELPVLTYFKQSFMFIILGVFMLLVIINIPYHHDNLIRMVLKIIIGAIAYLSTSLIYYFSYLKKKFFLNIN